MFEIQCPAKSDTVAAVVGRRVAGIHKWKDSCRRGRPAETAAPPVALSLLYC